MKLIIQIPCFNEAEFLTRLLSELPEEVPGFNVVEFLVVDDGSTDRTSEIAKDFGVHHVVGHLHNLGLARAFQTGLDACLKYGADVIVNTDADNQYPSGYIPALTKPVLEGTCDIAIGDRQTNAIDHFSAPKKLLQRIGSSAVRKLSGTAVADAPSGFRAYSREAALRLNVLTRFSYTLETIIQAGKQGLKILNVPIDTNPPLRESRLHKGSAQFVMRQMSTILRLYAFYDPLKTFALIALPFLMVGSGSWARFLYLAFAEGSDIGRHVQSLTMGTGLLVMGLMIILFGLQADISNKHRQLTQSLLYRLRNLEQRLFLDNVPG